MNEPDVTLTDYAVALECGLFAYWLLVSGQAGQAGQAENPLRLWFAIFFASIGVAALSGGTVHGYFPGEGTVSHSLLWGTTLIAIGVTALCGWIIGAQLYFSESVAVWIRQGAVVLFVLYCGVVLFVSRNFLVAIVYYLPATVFLLIVYGLVYQQGRESAILIGLLGLVLTFVAAGIQQAQWGFHSIYLPVSLSHNALYHVVQALALFFIYWSARWLIITR